MSEILFLDRRHAGRRLAERLEGYRHDDPIVLGLPRGGVVVAAEVARALGAPLDVVVARKIGAPFEPELAIGAVAPNDIVLIDRPDRFSEKIVTHLVEIEREEMKRRIRLYRGENRELPLIEGRSVIIVDDGFATGLTAQAAALAVQKEEPRHLVMAAPVGAHEAVRRLREIVDDVVCLLLPENFFAIGQWFVSFEQVSDDEVVALLHSQRGVAWPQS